MAYRWNFAIQVVGQLHIISSASTMPAGRSIRSVRSIKSNCSIISKANYGVVLKKVATIDVVTETWRHSVVINLPDVSSRIIQTMKRQNNDHYGMAYEGQGHINEAISMEVLSPTTSDIYPTLPSAH